MKCKIKYVLSVTIFSEKIVGSVCKNVSFFCINIDFIFEKHLRNMVHHLRNQVHQYIAPQKYGALELDQAPYKYGTAPQQYSAAPQKYGENTSYIWYKRLRNTLLLVLSSP